MNPPGNDDSAAGSSMRYLLLQAKGSASVGPFVCLEQEVDARPCRVRMAQTQEEDA